MAEVSVPAFQDFATIANHAENVCVVTFRALRAHLVWNTRVGTGVPVEQSSVPVCQQIVSSRQHAREHSWPNRPAATNRPVSARDLTDYGNRHAVLVRIDCVATFLLCLTHNELADDTRTTVAMVARQNDTGHKALCPVSLPSTHARMHECDASPRGAFAFTVDGRLSHVFERGAALVAT